MATPRSAGVFDELDPAWRAAFDEAWASARAGNFGIGAVLVDPSTGEIISRGRNRVAERPELPGVLAGNMTAHAEMNAFAGLDRFNAAGLHLYTTLEPCLMCASTAMLLKVEHVHLAVADEFFAELDALWEAHPVTEERRPRRSILDDGRADLASFARLLPMVFTIRTFPTSTAAGLARRTHPDLAGIVDRLVADADEYTDWLGRDLVDAIGIVRRGDDGVDDT